MHALNCPFCDRVGDAIADSSEAYAILDRFPVNEGHALIIPKRHVASYFDLTELERSACWSMVNDVQQVLQKQFEPPGFNVGINVGAVAGQTIFHVHIHLIPRYAGDVPEPRGGVRGVIPERRAY
jgi:diadenosine tetraphosphate (Ap4A) HIT family hydrolase